MTEHDIVYAEICAYREAFEHNLRCLIRDTIPVSLIKELQKSSSANTYPLDIVWNMRYFPELESYFAFIKSKEEYNILAVSSIVYCDRLVIEYIEMYGR